MRGTRQTLVGVVVAVLAACSGVTRPGGSGELVVSAAASLTDVFAEIAAAFEDEHPDARVVLNLGASSTLAEQILEGAPVDVFASANMVTVDRVVDQQGRTPAVFAYNRLQIIVPRGNPGGVTGLGDLARPGLLVGLCAVEVPCGSLARQALALADVVAEVDTNEANARSLLARVELGELDVAIVYETDVIAAAGRVEGIPIPQEYGVLAEYAIAVVGEDRADLAEAFLAFVLSEKGRAILTAHGFGLP